MHPYGTTATDMVTQRSHTSLLQPQLLLQPTEGVILLEQIDVAALRAHRWGHTYHQKYTAERLNLPQAQASGCHRNSLPAKQRPAGSLSHVPTAPATFMQQQHSTQIQQHLRHTHWPPGYGG